MPESAIDEDPTTGLTLLTRDVMIDPYPAYALLREHDPVHWDEQLNGWVITRHDDIDLALRDHGTFSSRRLGMLVSSRVDTSGSPAMAKFASLASHWMWMLDPPRHTRVRKLMNQGFSPRDVRGLEPLVRGIVTELVDAMLAKGEFDLIAEFCYPVPALVLVELYGLPRSDAPLITRWCDAIKVFLGGTPDLGGSGAGAAAAIAEMIDYLTLVIADRRAAPRDDLVSRLVHADDEGDRLDDDELCSNLLLLLMASFETTVDMLGNGLAGLLTQRDQWELLVRDQGLAAGAVEEVLRYDGPVQLTHRLLTADVELRGRRLRQGQLAYLVRGSGNRDAARFTDPDRIDITRSETGHFALGAGIHYCLGAGLSRLEGVHALTELARRVPGLALTSGGALRWRADNLQFRGLAELPAHVGTAT